MFKKKCSFSDGGVRNVGNWGAWNTVVQRTLPPFLPLPPSPPFGASLPPLPRIPRATRDLQQSQIGKALTPLPPGDSAANTNVLRGST